MKKLFAVIIICALLGLYLSCTSDLADGSSSDVECIIGYAIGANSKPVQGAQVTCCSREYLALNPGDYKQFEAVTDSTGYFEFKDKSGDNIPCGEYVILVVDSMGNGDKIDFELPEDFPDSVAEILEKAILYPNGTIRGTAICSTGASSGSVIHVYGTDKYDATDSEGRFSVTEIPSGWYTIGFSRDSLDTQLVQKQEIWISTGEQKTLDTIDVDGRAKLTLTSNVSDLIPFLTGSGFYRKNNEVAIRARGLHDGFSFQSWFNVSGGGATISSVTDTQTNVTLQSNVTIEAQYRDIEPPTLVTEMAFLDTGHFSITVAWQGAQDNDSITGYKLAQGSDSSNIDTIFTCTDTVFTITDLLPGTNYYIAVRSLDSTGNTSNWFGKNITTLVVDTIKPTKPPYILYESVNDNYVDVAWGPSSDNTKVVGYDLWYISISMSDTAEYFIKATNFTLQGLTPNTTYHIMLRAVDLAGNESDWLYDSVTTTATQDTTPPTTPTYINVEEYTESTISLKWEKSTDAVSTPTYQLKYCVVDSMDTLFMDCGTSYWAYLSQLLKNTSYSIAVRAQDKAGNYSGWKDTMVTTASEKDTIAPSKPGNFRTDAKSFTTLDFSWDAATDNMFIRDYTLRYVAADSLDTAAITVPSSFLTAIIDNLKPATLYHLFLSSTDNSSNSSEKAFLADSTLTE